MDETGKNQDSRQRKKQMFNSSGMLSDPGGDGLGAAPHLVILFDEISNGIKE